MKYTVLVVDDEFELRRALIEKVDWQSAGFEVIGEAENGIEALECIENLEPDLIITDIKMPMISGLELAKRIREIRPAAQIYCTKHQCFIHGKDKASIPADPFFVAHCFPDH